LNSKGIREKEKEADEKSTISKKKTVKNLKQIRKSQRKSQRKIIRRKI